MQVEPLQMKSESNLIILHPWPFLMKRFLVNAIKMVAAVAVGGTQLGSQPNSSFKI